MAPLCAGTRLKRPQLGGKVCRCRCEVTRCRRGTALDAALGVECHLEHTLKQNINAVRWKRKIVFESMTLNLGVPLQGLGRFTRRKMPQLGLPAPRTSCDPFLVW